MKFLDIVLVIVSSAGLLHGVLAAMYLIFFKKKKVLPNLFLGLILIFMAFRIGKSVMLYFGDDLEPVFIFVGLAFLVLIGPLLRWYVLGMTRPDFKLPRRYYFLELAPFMILFIASLFVTEEWYKNSKLVIIIFSSGLIFIYLHFAFYIALAWRAYKRTKAKEEQGLRTKSQKAVLQWLYVVLIGFILIWVSYVLNILDEAVPYVIGPIVYSVVVYYLSYRAFVLKVTDLDGSVFKVTGDHSLYDAIVNRIVKEQLYLEPDISLTRLSKMLGKSTQQISTVINQYANRNFNDFINYYRIQDAKALLLDPKSEKYTISSIAFDMGFSSLSSFNSAFKKFEGQTPSSFRKPG